MVESTTSIDKVIRVVVFGSGPRLETGVKAFLCRLEDHPEIHLLGAFFQAKVPSLGGIVTDLWQRRRLLAVLLLLSLALEHLYSRIFRSRVQIDLKKRIVGLAERVRFVPDLHASEVLQEIRRLDPELGLIYGAPILKPTLFQIPVHGTLGIHHGKVPEYRGKKTTFWAMYNGEKEAGVTIQRVNSGLDTGDTVRCGEVVIGRRPFRSVWNELEALGLELYIRAILDIKDGKAEFTPQDPHRFRLYRDPKIGDLIRFWGKYIVRLVSG